MKSDNPTFAVTMLSAFHTAGIVGLEVGKEGAQQAYRVSLRDSFERRLDGLCADGRWETVLTQMLPLRPSVEAINENSPPPTEPRRVQSWERFVRFLARKRQELK